MSTLIFFSGSQSGRAVVMLDTDQSPIPCTSPRSIARITSVTPG